MIDASSADLVTLAVHGSSDAAQALRTPVDPPTIDPAWQLLGWDVADTGLISALTNAGYLDEAERETAAAMFADRLNEHGLFRDIRDAERFREVSDVRVPEHRPFLVHGLFLVGW